LLRKRLIADERVLILHAQLPVEKRDPESILSGPRTPLDRDLVSMSRVRESLLRMSLVRGLVGEGLPALGLSGVDLGLFRQGEDGALRIDASRLGWLLCSGVLPVIGVDCLSSDGTLGRTTVCEITRTLARARDIHSVDVITSTGRVLLLDGAEALALRLEDLKRLPAQGPADCPTAPASQSAMDVALAALQSGVPTARIGSVASLVGGTATELTQAGRGVVVR
jgi:hypothetical protein